ncbi:hypothetical protein [Candidatus Acidianus copahuensis]|nr:hypothetical protein [Candidatus Acidianus copahuensis]
MDNNIYSFQFPNSYFPNSYNVNAQFSTNLNIGIIVNVDKEFGNLFIKFEGRETIKSEEGDAFVTIGIDKDKRISYISIEPDDRELKEFIKGINNS